MQSRDDTKANLITLLRNVLGHPVGDGRAPAGQTLADLPYLIVSPRDSSSSDLSGPPFWTPQSDACFYFDVTCVGGREDQAESVASAVSLAVAGRDAGTGELLHAWPGSDDGIERSVELLGGSDSSDDGRLAWTVVEVRVDVLG